jgi:integrase
MPSGACVVIYEGKRGRVFRIKYVDAGGRQAMETLGRAAEGWDRQKAERELRHRLADVDREGLRRLEPVTFASFAREWLDTYPDARGLKRSTRESYKTIIERHLIPVFGHLKVGAIDVRKVEEYVAAKRRAGFAPRTLNRQLNLVHELFEAGVRQQLIRSNPVKSVERPREPRRRWAILSPAEVARIERAFRELIEAAVGEERAWREQARVVFLTLLGTGVRRGELLGLRWRDVDLVDPEGPTLRVRATWVRGAEDTPKSEAGERTIALGPGIADELFLHRGRSSFKDDDEHVFCHPAKGSVLDHKHYAETLKLALAKAKVEKPMRPFHDARHSSITNAAAAGTRPEALMARSGHSDIATTQLYVDLSGERFREEADRLERRLFGAKL